MCSSGYTSPTTMRMAPSPASLASAARSSGSRRARMLVIVFVVNRFAMARPATAATGPIQLPRGAPTAASTPVGVSSHASSRVGRAPFVSMTRS